MKRKSITDTQIRAARPQEQSYTLYIERQLFLRVDPNSAKYWIFRYQWGNKQRPMGLGVYPEVKMQQAKYMVVQCRAWLRYTKVPILERKLAKERSFAHSEG